ncbi:hypothetical protein ACA910_012316 [Epithemia clementina (nom. ined.)]
MTTTVDDKEEEVAVVEEEVFQKSDAMADFKEPLSGDRGIYYSIPTMKQAERCAEANQGCESLEHKALRFLHSSKVQILLAGLLLLDVLILFIEMALLTLYPSCHIIERDAISCCPASGDDANTVSHNSFRWLEAAAEFSEEASEEHHYCKDGFAVGEYEAGCDEHKWRPVHIAEEVLFGITIGILSILLFENLVTLWALRPAVFFRQAFYVFDLFIVSVSLGLELLFHVLGEDNVASLAGLLVLGRVWRFVRISHGIAEVIADLSHEKYERLLEYTEKLEKVLLENNIEVPQHEKQKFTQDDSP